MYQYVLQYMFTYTHARARTHTHICTYTYISINAVNALFLIQFYYLLLSIYIINLYTNLL